MPIVALLALLSGPPVAPAAEAADPAVRASEAPQDLEAGWREDGFRLRMALGPEYLKAVAPAPEGTALHFSLEPAVQIAPTWSVAAQLLYTVERPLLDRYGLNGLRWSVTAGPAWHPWPQVLLGALVGVAGTLSNWHSPP